MDDNVRQAIAAYDAAAREYLRNCWLREGDAATVVNAYTLAKTEAHRALDAWAGRHAVEFQAEDERRFAALSQEKK